MPAYKDKERGTWFFEIKVKDHKGKYKKIKKRGFPTKKEALQAELEMKNNLSNSDKRTLNEVFKNYQEYTKTKKSINTFKTEEQRYNKHIRDVLGDKIFMKITANDIIAVQNKMIDNGYKNTFINTVITNLGTIFNYANKVLDLNNNAIQKIDKLKISKLDAVGDTWEVEEFNKFYNCIDDTFYKVLFYTLYYTGMRRGELLALKWKDYKNGELNIYKSYSKYGMGNTKTENSIRKVKLNPTNILLLDKLYSEAKRIDGFSKENFIFGGIKPISFHMLSRTKDKYIDQAEVKRIRIHDFRHSHASFLINHNIPLPAIASRLGDTINTVLDTYSHLFEKSMDEVLNLIESCGGNLGEKN